VADDLPRWQPAADAVCTRCHENPAGPGGIICPECRADIEAANRAVTEEGQ
jgi:hypothetical protein